MLPFELTKDTPYLALSGELWSVFYEYFNRNWPCYKGFLLYHDYLPLGINNHCYEQYNQHYQYRSSANDVFKVRMACPQVVWFVPTTGISDTCWNTFCAGGNRRTDVPHRGYLCGVVLNYFGYRWLLNDIRGFQSVVTWGGRHDSTMTQHWNKHNQ